VLLSYWDWATATPAEHINANTDGGSENRMKKFSFF